MMKKNLIKSAAVLFAAFSLVSVVVPPLTAQAEVLERMPADRRAWLVLYVECGCRYGICKEQLDKGQRQVVLF